MEEEEEEEDFFFGKVQDQGKEEDLDEEAVEVGEASEEDWICFSVVMVGWEICSSSGMVGRWRTELMSSRSSRNLIALALSDGILDTFSKRIV